MPYSAVGWQNIDVLDTIDAAVLTFAMCREAKEFVERVGVRSIREMATLLTTDKVDFWQTLDREFSPAQEEQKAGIVWTLMQSMAYDNIDCYNMCSVALICAIKNKAALMVIKIMVQLCPYALTYSDGNGQCTPAHLAIMHQSSLDVIRVLTQAGGNALDIVDSDGMSLLHYAALYCLPLDVVEYVYHLNPDSINYRTTNAHIVAAKIQDFSVQHANGDVAYIDNGEPFYCQGYSTALSIALQTRDVNLPNKSDGAVIEFLDRKSEFVKLVPDATGSIPFFKLLDCYYAGQYTETTMLMLLTAFCVSHSKHAQAAAFSTDSKNCILLKKAVRVRVSDACLEILCDFTTAQITNLTCMVDRIYRTREVYRDRCSGIHFAPENASFDAEGCITSVSAFSMRVAIPVFTEGVRCVSRYSMTQKTILLRSEALKTAKDLSVWINPTKQYGYGTVQSKILQNLILDLQNVFVGWRILASRRNAVLLSLNKVVAVLQQRISVCLLEESKLADQNASDLMASVAAESDVEIAKRQRPSRKSKHNAQKKRAAEEKEEAVAASVEAGAPFAPEYAPLPLGGMDAGLQYAIQQGRLQDLQEESQRQELRVRQLQGRHRLQYTQDEQDEQDKLDEYQALRSMIGDFAQHEDAPPEYASQAASSTSAKYEKELQEEKWIQSLLSDLIPDRSNVDPHTTAMRNAGWRADVDFSARFAAAVKVSQHNTSQASAPEIVDEIDFAECIFCTDNPITSRFLPCRHECYCALCCRDPKFLQRVKDKTALCPLCRNIIMATQLI